MLQTSIHRLTNKIFMNSIVMQYASNGDLAQKIAQKQKKSQLFKENEIWEVFINLLCGLKELHALQIFHRDIKSANVFLYNDRIAKLGDMNVSKISEKGLCLTQTGTPYYASPQVWKDQPYDSKSDIWSLGCVLYQMVTLKPPFRSEDMQGLYKKVIRGIYPRIPSEFSQDLSNLIRALLQTNPAQRPTCQKILKMPIIMKRMQHKQKSLEKAQLLKTIRVSDNIFDLGQQLPRANYIPLKLQKQKGIKSIIQTLDEKQHSIDKISGIQIQSLPALEKEKKIKILENSDRIMLKHKISVNMIEKQRQRKKSQVCHEKHLQINGQNCKSGMKDLKLPKVINRYNKQRKQRIRRQNSLRTQKVYDS